MAEKVLDDQWLPLGGLLDSCFLSVDRSCPYPGSRMKLKESCLLHQTSHCPRTYPGVRLYKTPVRKKSCLGHKTRLRERPNSSSAEGVALDEVPNPVREAASRQLPWWSSPHDGQILQFAIPQLLSNLALPLSYTVDTGTRCLSLACLEG